MITVEYLLPFDTKDGICKNIDSFKFLLISNSNFKLNKNKIDFKRSSYDFSVTLNIVEDKDCSVFHVTFGTSRVTDTFREMLKAFRRTVGLHLKNNIQIIWDGVSFEWSKKLYPKIYQVENSLRKLISKFMLINLGLDWHKSSIPNDVTESIKNYEPTDSILYEVDFIQLANFLFKSYSIKNVSKLPDILSKVIENGMDEEKKNEILDYLPKNNWDRYFSDLVDVESEQLNKKWQKLYEIRNKVAHNKTMCSEDFNIASTFCDELNKVFKNACENIENIEIPEKDKESIGLRTIETVNEHTSNFINNYLELNDSIYSVLKDNPAKYSFLENISNPIPSIVYSVINDRIKLPDELNNDLFSMNNYKNEILNGTSYVNPFSAEINDKFFFSKENDILSALNSDNIIMNPLINNPISYNSRIIGNEKSKFDNKNEKDENEK